MKIAVLHRYPPQQALGTNASCIEVLKKLTKTHADVLYVTFREKHEIPIPGVTFIRIPLFFNRAHNIDKVVKTYAWIFLVPLQILRLRLRKKVDIIYCDDSVPFYAFLCKLLNPGLKVIMRLGDLQIGYQFYDTNRRVYNLLLKIEVAIWKQVDGIIAISDAFKDFLILQGVDGEKISVVEESINLDEVPAMSSRSSHDGIIRLLFHGALLPCKGTTTLLKAFKMLNSKYANIHLTIAGGGGEESAIRNYIKANKIENITLTGWYSHEKLKEMMKRVDIGIVMRSGNFANNFVVTTCLLENWKYKKPVLVPDLKSFTSLIKDRKQALFYKVDDSEDLSRKITYLIEHPALCDKLAHSGYKLASERFSHYDIAQKLTASLLQYEKQN